MRRLQILFAVMFLLIGLSVPAATLADFTIHYTGDNLPSVMGWTYGATGLNAGVAEGAVFSVSGGILTQNTMGLVYDSVNGLAFGNLYDHDIPCLPADATLEFTARAIAREGDGARPLMAVRMTYGPGRYAVAITPTAVYVLNSPVTFADFTQFRTFRAEFDATAGTWDLYINNILVDGGRVPAAATGSTIKFGDLHDRGNASGEWDDIRLDVHTDILNCVTPVESTSWGMIKARYR